MITPIVPSFSDDLLEAFFASMERSQPGSVASVIVGDNGLSPAFRAAWPQACYVPVPADPFIGAQAINRCVAAAPAYADLLLLNDDMHVESPAWLERIESVLATLSPLVGIVNVTCPPTTAPVASVAIAQTAVAFLGGAIPRRVWNSVGSWDERYTGYGFEDTDYCFRLWHAGYAIGLTAAVAIPHTGSVGYIRRHGSWDAVRQLCDRSFEAFYTKWAIPMPTPRHIESFDAAPHMRRHACACPVDPQ